MAAHIAYGCSLARDQTLISAATKAARVGFLTGYAMAGTSGHCPPPFFPSKNLSLWLGGSSAHQVRMQLHSGPQAIALRDEHPWHLCEEGTQ